MEKAIAINKQSLRDIIQSLKNIAISSGGIVSEASSAGISTTGAITYMIDGVFATKAAGSQIALTECTEQAAGTRCRYLISLNLSGTVKVTKGTEVKTLSTGALTTLSWNAAEKKLKDSANSLSFVAGDKINVSGFTELANNGLFTVEVAASSGAWVQVRETGMVDEAAGDSVTVLRESLLPECPAEQAPVGIITVTTTTAAFQVGADDLDTSGVTVTFTNIGIMPTEFL